MACSSTCGVSSGSSGQELRYSGYHDQQNLQQIKLDQIRKRKRMVSNRESARRSRMRKQQQLDDLVSQMGQLRIENNHIRTNMSVTTQMYLNMDAENSVLKAQLAELNHRLESLSEIIECLNSNNGFLEITDDAQMVNMISGGGDEFLNNPWNLVHVNQPITIMASSADHIFMHCPTLGHCCY